MNALATLTSGSAASITSAEIAELTGKRHDNVRRTIETLIEQGVIALPQIEEKPTAGRPSKEYTFTGDQGKRDSIVVVAQLSPEFTARLVDRWQELEQQAALSAFNLPKTLPEAMRLAADALDGKAAAEAKVLTLQTKIEADAPKVLFASKVEVAPDSITKGQAAKIIGTGRNRFAAWLREIRWCNRFNEPYQDKIEAGLLDVKLASWEHPDHGLRQSVTTLITGKGLVKLQQLWAEHQKAIKDALQPSIDLLEPEEAV